MPRSARALTLQQVGALLAARGSAGGAALAAEAYCGTLPLVREVGTTAAVTAIEAALASLGACARLGGRRDRAGCSS